MNCFNADAIIWKFSLDVNRSLDPWHLLIAANLQENYLDVIDQFQESYLRYYLILPIVFSSSKRLLISTFRLLGALVYTDTHNDFIGTDHGCYQGSYIISKGRNFYEKCLSGEYPTLEDESNIPEDESFGGLWYVVQYPSVLFCLQIKL